MIAAFRSIASDEITAIQKTRLTPDGQKVGRRTSGVLSGAAIKFDPDDVVLQGLHIGEGAETCMSGRQFGLRPSWALGSKSQIAKFAVLGGVETLTILAEPDAEAEVRECAQRWHVAGREVLINRSKIGSDLNDALRGVA
jgi:putative DNA primase/helicase